jgi:hypothetical protein
MRWRLQWQGISSASSTFPRPGNHRHTRTHTFASLSIIRDELLLSDLIRHACGTCSTLKSSAFFHTHIRCLIDRTLGVLPEVLFMHRQSLRRQMVSSAADGSNPTGSNFPFERECGSGIRGSDRWFTGLTSSVMSFWEGRVIHALRSTQREQRMNCNDCTRLTISLLHEPDNRSETRQHISVHHCFASVVRIHLSEKTHGGKEILFEASILSPDPQLHHALPSITDDACIADACILYRQLLIMSMSTCPANDCIMAFRRIHPSLTLPRYAHCIPVCTFSHLPVPSVCRVLLKSEAFVIQNGQNVRQRKGKLDRIYIIPMFRQAIIKFWT